MSEGELKHTTTTLPWSVGWHDRGHGLGDYGILDNSGNLIAKIVTGQGEHAELIVRCVNAHGNLLEACRGYLRIYCDSDMRPEDECAELYSRVKAAIAEAETP